MKLENIQDEKHYLLTHKQVIFSGAQVKFICRTVVRHPGLREGAELFVMCLEETDLPVTHPHTHNGLPPTLQTLLDQG